MKEAKKLIATEISAGDLRKSLGEVFDRVQYTGRTYVVTRKGREIGAIVPAELAHKLELLERGRKDALLRLASMLDEKPDLVEDDEAATAAAVEGVREMRKAWGKPRKARGKPAAR